ncbi:MAG TPA: ATP-binding cassette domain-containing protein [Alphaproteobacteria bacterium]|nr:ATP-binding cassette domain-containing protein [Alphaproteobacteria bacterium]
MTLARTLGAALDEEAVADLEQVRRERGSGSETFRLEIERFRIAPRECIAIVGPSGSGKSTFLDLLSLSLAPSAASRFRLGAEGEDIVSLWRRRDAKAMARLRRTQIGYVLQSGALLPFLSAAENVALPLRLTGRMREPERARVRALLAQLGLERVSRHMPAQLSIGQRQRVAVARALVHRPRIVLADEPTASLDAEAASAVMTLLVELAGVEGAAVLLVSHDELLSARHGFAVVACRPVPSVAGLSRSVIRRDT